MHTAAGVSTGQRATLSDGRVPCEILHVGPHSVEDPVLTARVHFPRQQDRARLGATRSYANIRVEIDVPGREGRQLRGDFGDAMFITGGLHVGGDLTCNDGDTSVCPWGNFVPVDRSRPRRTDPWEGQRWSLTLFSWSRAGAAQRYASWMMDSVTMGSLLDQGHTPGPLEVANTREPESAEPWADAEVDEHGVCRCLSSPRISGMSRSGR